MSDPRRILEPGSDAPPLLRDLVSSARSDTAPEGARKRARARMEAALGSEGMTTAITSLSEGAAGMLILPNLTRVSVPPPAARNQFFADDTGPVSAEKRRARSDRKVVYASAGGAMALVVGLIGISLLVRKSPPVPAPVAAPLAPVAPVAAPIAAPVAPTAAPSPSVIAPVALAPVAPAGGGGGGGGAESAGGGGSSAGSGGHARAPRGGGGGGGGGSVASAGGGGGAASSGGGSSAAASGGGGSSPCSQRCHGNINCLLRCSTQTPAASGGGGSGSAHSNAPDMPSRNDVISALRGAAPRVSACGHGRTGMAQISITFGSTGHVTTANVAAPYAGTPAGACMARAVRSATLPRFSRPSFTVNYPFSIR